MIGKLISFQNLYRFPTGRVHHSLRGMLDAIEGSALEDLRDLIEQALAHNADTKALEEAWKANKGQGEHAPEAQELHRELNRHLNALDEYLASAAKVLEPGQGREAAARARERLFPVDLYSQSRQPFVEESYDVLTMLERIRDDPPLARSLRELGAQGLVERLGDVQARFHAAIQERPTGTQYSEVLRARERRHELVVQVFYLAVGELVRRRFQGPEADVLTAALEGLLGHNEAIKRYLRRRRRISDVSLETGEELEPLVDDDASAVEEVRVASPMKLHGPGKDEDAEAA